jgi:hypothetical protein
MLRLCLSRTCMMPRDARTGYVDVTRGSITHGQDGSTNGTGDPAVHHLESEQVR